MERQKVFKGLIEKAGMKQDVFAASKSVFSMLKAELERFAAEAKQVVDKADQRVAVEYKTNGPFECHLIVGGDTLVFQMHSNVFCFPPSHPVLKSPYVQANAFNGYCGIVNIYNFLTDSYRYQRLNDSGYLVGRLFVNREQHFFVEGRGAMGAQFNQFATAVVNAEQLSHLIETSTRYVLGFDLYTPPFAAVREVSLDAFQSTSQDLKMKTGKRLGFRFQSEQEPPSF